MPYLSTLLGKPVTDVEGNRVGRLEGLMASLRGTMPYPTVAALAVWNLGGLRNGRVFAPLSQASVGFITLHTAILVLSPFLPPLST